MGFELPRVGDRFADRYQLEAVLGSGGMGCVYRAIDLETMGPVALKILKPEADGYTAETEARFHREVEIIASLSSPHTVTMYSAGRDPGGRLFMVFELAGGEDLSTLISRAGRLDPPTTTHILKQVLHALRDAHDLGLLHRDVKPDNIRVHERHGDEVVVKLLDFGIARRSDGSQSITRTGELVGTPRYMSPEQLTERPLSPASDLYSLGIVAFEMLMGATSLQGPRWTDQVDRLMTGHVFSIPEAERVGPLASIVTKMCARDPEDRYPSAAAVLSALERIEDRPSLPTMRRIEAKPAGITTRQRIASIPTWMWIVAGAVVVGLLWAGTQVVWRDGDKPRRPLPVPQPTEPASIIKATQPERAPPLEKTAAVVEPRYGCGAPAPFEGSGELEVTEVSVFGSLDESWLVYVPKGYDAKRRHPLVIVFHQDAQGPAGILAETRFDEVADREGAVLLLPRWGRAPPAWVGFDYASPTQRGVREVMKQLCMDPEQVFVLGHGPGGRAAVEMPCVLDHVTAIATTSYGMTRGTQPCSAFTDTPFLQLLPLKDGNIPPEGGPGCSLIDKYPLAEQESILQARSGCSGDRRVLSRHKGSVCYTWTCEAELVSCHLDGGRGWPGSGERDFDALNCDGPRTDFPYAETIWDFFVRHSH